MKTINTTTIRQSDSIKMKIYLMRHGLTEWNKSWRLQGRTDIDLCQEGIQQANQAYETFKEIPFDKVISSPLRRAKITADIVSAGRDIAVETDDRLIEMCFGIHEGTTPENDSDLLGREKLFKDPENYIADETAESYESLAKRCRSFLEDLKSLEGKNENILIVGHGALNKGIIREILNADLKDFWNFPWIDNCGAAEILLENGIYSMNPEYEVFRR